MRFFSRSLTDALRRLLVVIGCVVLATAQPMSARAASATTPDTILYPQGNAPQSAEAVSTRANSGGSGQAILVVAVLLALAGAWLLLKRRAGGGRLLGPKVSKKLQIEETRSLGNRQYLVVAAYEEKRFLLGVTPGQIQLLTDLPNQTEKASE